MESGTIPKQSGSLSRRQFLGAAVAGGVSLSVAPALLTACSTRPPQAARSAKKLNVAIGGFENNLTPFTVTFLALPNTHDLIHLVHDALFWSQARQDPEPYLAESAEANSDRTVWTVKLRRGVVWHDGPTRPEPPPKNGPPHRLGRGRCHRGFAVATRGAARSGAPPGRRGPAGSGLDHHSDLSADPDPRAAPDRRIRAPSVRGWPPRRSPRDRRGGGSARAPAIGPLRPQQAHRAARHRTGTALAYRRTPCWTNSIASRTVPGSANVRLGIIAQETVCTAWYYGGFNLYEGKEPVVVIETLTSMVLVTAPE